MVFWKKFGRFKKQISFVGFLICILLTFLCLFFKFFDSDTIISYGDKTHTFNKGMISSWMPYFYNGIPRGIFIYSQGYQNFLTHLFSLIRLNTSEMSLGVFILPILLQIFVSFWILSDISGSSFYGCVGTLLLLLSGMTLEYLLFFPVPYFFALTSFFILFWGTYKSLSQGRLSLRTEFILIFASTLIYHPFFFIIYVVFFLLYSLFNLINQFSKINFFRPICLFLVIFLINSYWLIPFFVDIFCFSASPEGVYGTSNLEAVSYIYTSNSSLLKIILGSSYPVGGAYQIVQNHWTIVPVILVFSIAIGFLCIKKEYNPEKFLSIALLFFLGLSFWPTNPLIFPIWDYLWINFPFFKFFRSFNRFSVIVFPLVLFLIGVYYQKVSRRRYLNFLLVLILASFFVGRRQLFSGDFGGYIPGYKIPNEYSELNDYLNKHGGHDLRVLVYPEINYEVYWWNKNRSFKEFQQIFYFIEVYLDATVLRDKAANHVFRNNTFYKKAYDYESCILDREGYINMLRKLDIDYILFQKDLIDFNGDLVPYEPFLGCLRGLDFSPTLSNRFFELDKISLPPKIYKTHEIYPFLYSVEFLSAPRGDFEFLFPQNFDIGWKLYKYKGNVDNLSLLNKLLLPLFATEIPIQNRDMNPGNGWLLPEGFVSSEGENLYLYYYPQLYVYLGFLISITTLIPCSLWLLIGCKNNGKGLCI